MVKMFYVAREAPDKKAAVVAAILLDRVRGLRSVVLWGPGEQPLATALREAAGDPRIGNHCNCDLVLRTEAERIEGEKK